MNFYVFLSMTNEAFYPHNDADIDVVMLTLTQTLINQQIFGHYEIDLQT